MVAATARATAGALKERFNHFSQVGGIIGTLVSAAVLIILGIANALIILRLTQRPRVVPREEVIEGRTEGNGDKRLGLDGGSILVRIFHGVFKLIDRPWKVDPLGVLLVWVLISS